MKMILKRVASLLAGAALVVSAFPAMVSAGSYSGTNGKIAYSSSTGVKILNSDGTGVVSIPGTDSLSGHPRISPDGTKVVWTQYNGSASSDYANIKVANVDGSGSATSITTGTSNRNDGASWSPDGKWLIFAQDTSLDTNLGGAIMIVDAAGGTATQLINAVACTGGSTIVSDGWEEPSWSPDGSTIALINRCDAVDGGVYTFHVTTYTAGSSTKPTISSGDLSTSTHVTTTGAAGFIDYWPSWSPDGTTLIFTEVDLNTGQYSILLADNTAGSTTTNIVDGGTDAITMAVFSPDGTQVAYNQQSGSTVSTGTLYLEDPVLGGPGTAISSTANTGATSVDWGPAVGSGGTTTTVSDNQSSTPFTVASGESLVVSATGTVGTVTVQSGGTASINGTAGNVTVESGGTLKGTGTVGTVAVQANAHVAPGNSPGCLNAGNTTFASGSNLDIEIAGTTACTEYDQYKVTGTINLGSANLNVSMLNNFAPATGATFKIVDNDGADPVTGTFANLAEGATVTSGSAVFKISYVGGDGNDVVLTAVGTTPVPGTPNTGMKLVMANPLVVLLVTSSSAAVLFDLARKQSIVLNRIKK